MIAVVLALGLQVVWLALRVVLQQDTADAHLVSLSIALMVSTHVAVGLGAMSLARRHTSMPRVGLWLAAGGQLAIAATALMYACLPASHDSPPPAWVIAMYVWGWYALEAISITGFAIAAGRRGLLLGPPAIGCALLHASNPVTPGVDVLVFGGIAAVLVALMAIAADRRATAVVPDPARGASGLRGMEVLAWIAAAESVFSMSLAIAHVPSSIYISLPWACISIALEVTFVIVAWSIARAGVAGRWPWYLAATSTLWAVVRHSRSWLRTVTHHWGGLDQVKLVKVHWSVHVPGVLAMVAALVGVAVFARRRGLREVALAAIATAMFVLVVFAVRIAIPNEYISSAGCYVLANIAAARIYRKARAELAGGVPAARVL